ncbi:hypothetical protein E0Z10_g5611 [Xylaria hypoxylon]|uniref:DUF7918 domain-containing protein n=1 Tax=Xylaria hypoxylon TaxID=37992 RepID=A0A4Z0YFQ9_9PEZI|nr:hypothetical protein E0Z10_g5611 [Xylaria hypoxylon]
MAIIQGLPGLEVTIYTNDGTSKEYDDPSGADEVERCSRVVTKYIECKDDQLFGIHLKATEEYSWGFKDHVLNFAAVIDGIWAKGEHCRQEYIKEDEWEGDISYRVAKNPNGRARYVVQGFAFANITKVDSPTTEHHESETKRMEQLGTIEVKVYRMLLERGKGAILVPAGDHPKDFTVPQEITNGKSPSHGTKFTNTQPATKPPYIKCSKLSEDNGPIAIFRFKYRSQGKQFPLTFNSIQCNSRPNQNYPSGGQQTKRKPEKEEGNNADNIRPPLSDPNASHNSNANPEPPPRLEYSIFSDSQPSHSRVQRSVSSHNNAGANIPKEGMVENCRRITNQEAEQVVDDLVGAIWANCKAHFVAVKLESESEDRKLPPEITSAGKRPLDKTGSQNKSEQPPFTISDDYDKDKPQKSSPIRVDGNHNEDDVPSVQEISTPRTSWSSDAILPSIEKDNNVPQIQTTTAKAKTKTKTKATINAKNTIPRNMGGTTVIDDRQKPAHKSVNQSLPHRLRSPDDKIQNVKKSPPNTKCENRAVIKQGKSHFAYDESRHRRRKRLRELQQEFYRVLNAKENASPPATRGTDPNNPPTIIPIPPPPSQGNTSTPNGAASTVSLGALPSLDKPGKDSGKEVAPRAAKRKFGETIEGPIRIPRPFKPSKTRDGRELIDLGDSD